MARRIGRSKTKSAASLLMQNRVWVYALWKLILMWPFAPGGHFALRWAFAPQVDVSQGGVYPRLHTGPQYSNSCSHTALYHHGTVSEGLGWRREAGRGGGGWGRVIGLTAVTLTKIIAACNFGNQYNYYAGVFPKYITYSKRPRQNVLP